MRTNIRVVLAKYRTADVYLVKEVVGSLTPEVGTHLGKREVQKLIDERTGGGTPVYDVVLRAGK